MAEAKKQLVKMTSPKLTLVFPKLSDVDYGSNDYPKPDGEYSTKGKANAEDAAIKAFIAKLEPHYKAAETKAEEEFAKLKVETRKKLGGVKMNSLFTTLYDQETEEPTGEIEFKFAMAASGVVKKGPREGKVWTARPDLFDAKGLPIKGTPVLNPDGSHQKDKAGKPIFKMPAIWGGSTARVSFELSPYFIPGTGAAGLKLKLIAAQIIEMKSGGSRSASDYGFGEEEGYSYEGEENSYEGGEEGEGESLPGGMSEQEAEDF
ncbi:hypothetical protein [Labrys neptuniae]